MSKFKVGPTKTRSGNGAYIYAIADKGREPILGQLTLDDGTIESCGWSKSGSYYQSGTADADLIPNVEPKAFAGTVSVPLSHGEYTKVYGGGYLMDVVASFAGKTVKLTITEVLE